MAGDYVEKHVVQELTGCLVRAPRRQLCGSADKDHVIASGENVGLEQWGLKHGGVERWSGVDGAVITIVGEGEEAGQPDALLLDVGRGQMGGGREPKEPNGSPIPCRCSCTDRGPPWGGGRGCTPPTSCRPR